MLPQTLSVTRLPFVYIFTMQVIGTTLLQMMLYANLKVILASIPMIVKLVAR